MHMFKNTAGTWTLSLRHLVRNMVLLVAAADVGTGASHEPNRCDDYPIHVSVCPPRQGLFARKHPKPIQRISAYSSDIPSLVVPSMSH
jgi:phosphoenolpyruvate synthase/pyruvate phosphate dikinase